MKILRGIINNWKSFPHIDDPKWVDYADLNILIGSNSHGKSNYTNALRFIFFGNTDYGGIPRQIEKIDANNPNKPIQLDFDVSIEGEIIPLRNHCDFLELRKKEKNVDGRVKGRLFPSGINRQISTWGHQRAFMERETKNFELAQKHWAEIREDFYSFFRVSLSQDPPKRNDILDVQDENGVAINEIGNGYASVLFFMLELVKHGKECTVFMFEEPESHMHPALQRDFITYLISLIKLKQFQFFITTHSSIFIDNTLLNDVSAKILHIVKENQQSRVISPNNLKSKFHLLYDHLGYQPSQLLLSNCIVWVEGPSDRIYIKKWIADRTNTIEEFKHYTIMFYGGSLLFHLTFDQNELDKFIELSKINVNAAIIIDSDKKSGKENLESSKYQTKKRIAEDIASNRGFSWITEGKEIENYIQKEIFENVVNEVHRDSNYSIKSGKHKNRTKLKNGNYMDKVKVAQKVVERTKDKKLTADKDTSSELDSRINDLVIWIKNKNNIS